MNVQRNSHQLKHNDHLINWTFRFEGRSKSEFSAYAHAQILAKTNHWIRLYNLVLCDVFKMMITKLFYFDLSGKNFSQKILKSKNFKQKLRHQVVEAEAIKNCRFHIPGCNNSTVVCWYNRIDVWMKSSIGVILIVFLTPKYQAFVFPAPKDKARIRPKLSPKFCRP